MQKLRVGKEDSGSRNKVKNQAPDLKYTA